MKPRRFFFFLFIIQFAIISFYPICGKSSNITNISDLNNFHINYAYKDTDIKINSTENYLNYSFHEVMDYTNLLINKGKIQEWKDQFHLYLNFTKISNSLFDCSIEFCAYGIEFLGDIIYDSENSYYYQESNPTQKFYMPFILPQNSLSGISIPIATVNRTGIEIAYIDKTNIDSSPGFWQQLSYYNKNPETKIDSYDISVPYPEGWSINGAIPKFYMALQYYDQKSLLFVEGTNLLNNMEIFLEMSCSEINYVSLYGQYYLIDTDLPLSLHQETNNNNSMGIFLLCLGFGIPAIFTIIWKKKQKNRKIQKDFKKLKNKKRNI